ncbi:hypothetical protein N7476_009177 [Penicillium atrosanguineum]|uniref:RRM domain-containing protein n=1 Tax=Penicillium atrosanguineum TaxID=1132637 RepID=A0A9W9PTE1_9EURO|nr:hypothetical protein N7476_009177 [Penicillium atrosanguineum]
MGYTTYIESTTLSPDILPIPSIGILIALLLLIAFFIYFSSRSTSPLPLSSLPIKSKSKMDMASVMNSLEPMSKSRLIGLSKANLLDGSPEFEHPTLLPRSIHAPELIIREVLASSRSRGARGRGLGRNGGSRRAPQVFRLIDCQGSPIYLGSDSASRDITPELIPGLSEKIVSPDEIRLQLANPQDWIDWAINGSTVFDNKEDEVAAARCPGTIIGPEGVKSNMFFQWGLRYVPPRDAGNVYRAVVIENLPQCATLDQILPRIRGGQIYSASLCDTKNIMNGSPTAIVSFIHQDGALAFLSRVAQEGFYMGFTPVRVRPVSTPTYLLSQDMENNILQNGRSRCLVFTSHHPTTRERLYSKLAKSSFSSHVECFGEHGDNGTITVRFDSIKTAIQVYQILNGLEIFKEAKFGTDPCSEV